MEGNQTQPISDDQELAKVLEGVQKQSRAMATSDPAAQSMQYEETPAPGGATTDTPAADPVATPAEAATNADAPAVTPPTATTTTDTAADRNNPALDAIKKEALEELRPLVTKLKLPAKEKFDTMLLIIRSTDDQELLGPAHEAAKTIEDETERAQALLDIVKEIDYFASQTK